MVRWDLSESRVVYQEKCIAIEQGGTIEIRLKISKDLRDADYDDDAKGGNEPNWETVSEQPKSDQSHQVTPFLIFWKCFQIGLLEQVIGDAFE